MFRDLGELEHIFEQLDIDSELPGQERLNWICGKNSEFNIRINALMKSVCKLELAHGVTPGKSYQSEILANLYYRIQTCTKPSILKAYLPELKELLFKAYVISLDRRIDSVRKYSLAKNELVEHGSKFRGTNKRNTDALGTLLLQILVENGKKTPAKAVINKLSELADNNHKLIDEVDDEAVYWNKNKKTSFKRISDRLSTLRKRI
ncbi:hypothetical protein [Nitrosomonas marina]|uniref:Uncharacterized protein n=1 Tax=Nitrosomonas marina TaxID=917 RepID=A0A1H8B3R0_9PROT|nr:hypothetical protein [Nitrosomonas marina]SEM77541.1 hypothetical protein SAMN05216325_10289 [Nitrosomonas marina]